MDLNDVRSLVTLLSFLLFGALMAWTWWPRRRADLDAAARLPFLGEGLGDGLGDGLGKALVRNDGRAQ